MKRVKSFPTLNAQKLMDLESGEKIILREYCRILRGRKSLSETTKIKLLRDIGKGSARRRLVLHYLPFVVRKALDENDSKLLLRRIAVGNQAVLACFQKELVPYDDVDYFVEKAIETSFSNHVPKVSAKK
jgi:hypothetical protein